MALIKQDCESCLEICWAHCQRLWRWVWGIEEECPHCKNK